MHRLLERQLRKHLKSMAPSPELAALGTDVVGQADAAERGHLGDALSSGLSRTMPPLKSVAIGPGATVLTAIPRAPSSWAR